MFVSAFAVLALALSAIAAPVSVPQKSTDPQTHDVTPAKSNTKDGATPLTGLPAITSPHAGDVWTDGQVYSVAWTVSDDLKAKTGTLVLGPANGQLDLASPLAKDVPLSEGSVTVTPNSPAGDYIVALLVGDAKDEVKSSQFTIKSTGGNGSTNDKDTDPTKTGAKDSTKDKNDDSKNGAGSPGQTTGTTPSQAKNL